MTDVAFVNDWSELEAATVWLHSFLEIQEELRKDETTDLGFSQEFYNQLSAFVDYVPRLLTQYASLLELSFTLTESWEKHAALQPKTGLYLPDHG